MENKLLFYKAASALPDGLSLTDYEYRFYKDNAGKEILSAEVISPVTGDTLVYDSVADEWVNKTVVPVGGSAGQVLVKDSGTDYDASWVNPRFLVKPKVNDYIGTALGGGSSAFNFPVNRLVVFPIMVRQPVAIDRIGINVTTAEASSVIRLGLYENVDGAIGDLIIDAGTVNSSTTGSKTITISETLDAGLVWGAAVFQNSTSTLAVSHGFDNTLIKVPSSLSVLKPTENAGVYQDGVSGALPSTVTPNFDQRRVPIMGLRVSAVL
jgi:hypothetical protein